jgi:hypothetical protein
MAPTIALMKDKPTNVFLAAEEPASDAKQNKNANNRSPETPKPTVVVIIALLKRRLKVAISDSVNNKLPLLDMFWLAQDSFFTIQNKKAFSCFFMYMTNPSVIHSLRVLR